MTGVQTCALPISSNHCAGKQRRRADPPDLMAVYTFYAVSAVLYCTALFLFVHSVQALLLFVSTYCTICVTILCVVYIQCTGIYFLSPELRPGIGFFLPSDRDPLLPPEISLPLRPTSLYANLSLSRSRSSSRSPSRFSNPLYESFG